MGVWRFRQIRVFIYIPDQDFFGEDSFTYRLDDGLDSSNTATVRINVLPVNDPPVFANLVDTLNINQNTPLQTLNFETSPGPNNESNQNIVFEAFVSKPGFFV